MMKISLFFKSYAVKASMFLLVLSIVACSPAHTEASFFSGLISKVTGADADASQVAPKTDEVVHNSQTMTLLESSINPDMKSSRIDSTPISIIENQGLISTDGSLDVSDDLEKYASTEKISTYKVKKGDTIEGIAKKFKVPQSVILESNADLKKSDLLKVGQVLAILSIKDIPNKNTVVEKEVKDTKDTKTSNSTNIQPKKAETPVVAAQNEEVKTSPLNTIPQVAQDQVVPENTASSTNNVPTPEDQSSGNISGDYIWPFPKGVGRVSQGLHADSAYDFAAPKGTPIYAVHDGTVLIARSTGYNGGYGLYVVIDFTDGRQAIFGHMSKVVAKAGDVVKQGDIIGYVGSTGKSTGPHTHAGFRGKLGNPYEGLKVNSKDIIDND